jgi:alpha-glucosidase
MIRRCLALLVLALAFPAAPRAQESATAAAPSAPAGEVARETSPDGRIALSVIVDSEGHAFYALARDGRPLIAPSRLGFLFTDQDPFARGIRLVAASRSQVDTQWEQPWGERRFVRDRHRELLVTLRDRGGADARVDAPVERTIAVRFRLFDDGFAFRYELPDRPGGGDWHIADELTEVTPASGGTAWWIQGGDWNRYEQLYRTTPIDAVGTAHTPITMKLDGGPYLAIHEAALVDYAGYWLKRMDGLRFRTTLSPSSQGPRVARAGAFTTPWRSIRIADTAPGLYDNDLELNLNEPNKLGDVRWVKPYKYVGVWWEMHLGKASWSSGPAHGATTANTRRYIDFAARHGFRGVLVEGWNKGWDGTWFGNGRDFSFTQPDPDFDLAGLSAYGLKKGVHLIGHHETGGNIASYEAQLDDAMALYARLGVDSVKTGYVADAGGIIAPGDSPGTQRMEWHDGQRQVQHHLKVVETAARYRIAVNPHEPVKDTGLRRTWPNWVSREGARGAEYDAWGTPKNPPYHVPALYFTRMLSGPMDYTPGILSLKGKDGSDFQSTIARQLALYLVIYSPIQMAADLPENYARFPRELAFIEAVPTDWAETRTLAGEPARYVVVARKDRASEAWYVGGVTDEEARDAVIDFAFLPAGTRYRARLWRDAPDSDYRADTRHKDVIEDVAVRAGDKLTVRMAPGGGFAMRLLPVK